MQKKITIEFRYSFPTAAIAAEPSSCLLLTQCSADHPTCPFTCSGSYAVVDTTIHNNGMSENWKSCFRRTSADSFNRKRWWKRELCVNVLHTRPMTEERQWKLITICMQRIGAKETILLFLVNTQEEFAAFASALEDYPVFSFFSCHPIILFF